MQTKTSEAVELHTLKSSINFFPKDRIPRIDARTSFEDVYKQLDGRGAFFLVKDGKATNYVRAYLLAAMVVRNALENARSNLARDAAVRDEDLRRNMAAVSARSIEEIVEEVWRQAPVLSIHQIPPEIGADRVALANLEDRVFDIFEAGEHVGWYLNHESVRDATTDKTIFVCTNPAGGHDNTDSDHGTCSRCPYPIGSTKKVRVP